MFLNVTFFARKKKLHQLTNSGAGILLTHLDKNSWPVRKLEILLASSPEVHYRPYPEPFEFSSPTLYFLRCIVVLSSCLYVASFSNSCTSVYFTSQVSKFANLFNSGRIVEDILRFVKTEPILEDELPKKLYSPCQQDVKRQTFETTRKLQVTWTEGLQKTFGDTAWQTRLKLSKSGSPPRLINDNEEEIKKFKVLVASVW